MTNSHSRRGKRRRAVRPSDSPDYDRTADRPPFVSAFGSADAERAVEVDDGPQSLESPDGDGTRGEAFYREQIPPHY